jgi:hypothetical protein
MKYKIKWRSKNTGTTGEGTGKFSKEEAERIAKKLNEEEDAICVHWVAPCYERLVRKT